MGPHAHLAFLDITGQAVHQLVGPTVGLVQTGFYVHLALMDITGAFAHHHV